MIQGSMVAQWVPLSPHSLGLPAEQQGLSVGYFACSPCGWHGFPLDSPQSKEMQVNWRAKKPIDVSECVC